MQSFFLRTEQFLFSRVMGPLQKWLPVQVWLLAIARNNAYFQRSAFVGFHDSREIMDEFEVGGTQRSNS